MYLNFLLGVIFGLFSHLHSKICFFSYCYRKITLIEFCVEKQVSDHLPVAFFCFLSVLLFFFFFFSSLAQTSSCFFYETSSVHNILIALVAISLSKPRALAPL